MSTTYEKAPQSVLNLAAEILCAKPRHKPLLDQKVKIDFMFAHGERDEKTGNIVAHALKKNGIRALGIARKVNLKDRAKGCGDAEICIDADWWDEEATERQREAVLAHELNHLAVKIDKRGIVRDDLGRPAINIVQHDHEFGWFTNIANEYGADSQEVIQCRRMIEVDGQYLLPGMVTIKA